ncbi:hypothetical protein Hanom_Chr15g01396481 [Helianthus anomalus]
MGRTFLQMIPASIYRWSNLHTYFQVITKDFRDRKVKKKAFTFFTDEGSVNAVSNSPNVSSKSSFPVPPSGFELNSFVLLLESDFKSAEKPF